MSYMGTRRALLGGGFKPIFFENFLTESGLPSANFLANFSYSGPSLKPQVDASGLITYGPNNLVTNSNDLTQSSWTKTGGTPTFGSAGPTGALNASLFTESSGNAQHQYVSPIIVSANTNNVVSVNVARNGARYVYIDLTDLASGDAVVYFDLQAGTYLGSSNSGSWTNIVGNITPGQNGYFIISFSAARNAGTGYGAHIGINQTNALSVQTFTGDGTSGLFFYLNCFAAVTHETAPRPQDQVVTTSAAYYGLRINDYSFTSVGTPLGALIEEARTNIVLWNRDLTNAAWSLGATMTSAKDQTGIDGVANSASSLTAGLTPATDTISQAVTLASSARFQTAYIKRITGTGAVNMSTDGGTTKTDVSSLINSSTYTRVSIPTQTLANPTIWFQLGTAGDKIAIDGIDNENGTFATSVIFTAASAVARSADVLQAVGSFLNILNSPQGTVFVETGGLSNTAVASYILGEGSTTSAEFYTSSTTAVGTYAGSTNFTSQTIGGSGTFSGIVRSGLGWSGATQSLAANGSVALPVSFAKILTGTRYLGSATDVATRSIDGHVRNLAAYQSRLQNNQIQRKSIVGAPY